MKQSGIPTKKLLNLYKKYSDGEYGVIVTGCIMINGVSVICIIIKSFTEINNRNFPNR